MSAWGKTWQSTAQLPWSSPQAFVQHDWHWRQKLLHTSGEIRIARRRIHHLVKLAREAAKVVDGARRRRDSYTGAWRKPVCGDAQYRFGPRNAFSQSGPRIRVGVPLQGIHGISMTNKDCRQLLAHQKNPTSTLWPLSIVCRSYCRRATPQVV